MDDFSCLQNYSDSEIKLKLKKKKKTRPYWIVKQIGVTGVKEVDNLLILFWIDYTNKMSKVFNYVPFGPYIIHE